MGNEKEFHLMVVEDEPVDVYLIKRVLEDVDYPVRLTVARDGEECFEVLSDLGTDLPDLILLDINMPRKDGRETLIELKADPTLQTIPVTMFTTSEWKTDKDNCYAWGANGYINKPDSLEGYRKTLQVVRQFWLSTHAGATRPSVS